ncbi:MAG: TIM barrel protein [Clostridia bacterium]
MERFKIGVCSWCLPTSDLYESLEILKEVGLDGMELDVSADFANSPLLSAEFCEKYLQKATEYGLEFTTTALNGIGSCNPFNDGENKALQNYIKAFKQIATNMKLKIIQVPAFGGNALNVGDNFEKAVTLYQDICDQISPYGLTLASENTISGQENLELIKRVNRENFAVYFDTQNPLVFSGYKVPDMISMLNGHIAEFHLKDGTTTDGNTSLGFGNSEFHESAKRIINSDYSGFLNIETMYKKITSSKEETIQLIKKDIAQIKDVFSI